MIGRTGGSVRSLLGPLGQLRLLAIMTGRAGVSLVTPRPASGRGLSAPFLFLSPQPLDQEQPVLAHWIFNTEVSDHSLMLSSTH